MRNLTEVPRRPRTSVVELVGPDDILAKMTYVLTNPVKDHLVDRADQWPGASSRWANLNGGPVCARRPAHFFRKDGQMPESVALRIHQAPGFEQLGSSEWRALLADRIGSVEAAARDERRGQGRYVLGRAAVLRQRPTDCPQSHEARRQMCPRIASANKWARIEAIQRNKAFLAAYRAARELWKMGGAAIFPVGTYWLRKFAGVIVEGLATSIEALSLPA